MPGNNSDQRTLNNSSHGVQVTARELIQLRFSAGNLKLDQWRRVSTTLAGLQHSRFRGRGVDYLESRVYQPGDDIRSMDWRVTARTGEPHTKIYQEERERPVILIVDHNPSMYFGTRVAFKSVVAARLATLIAWIAVNQGDHIGLLLFGSERSQQLAPAGGSRSVMKLIRHLVAWSALTPDTLRQQTPLNTALGRLGRIVRPGSLIFIISDFYTLDDQSGQHLTRLQQHNDIVACQINDILETKPPPPGRYGITDGYNISVLDTHSPQLQQRYHDYFQQHHRRINDLMRQRNIAKLTFMTADDPATILRRQLLGSTFRPG